MTYIPLEIINEVELILKTRDTSLIDFKYKKKNGKPYSHRENFEQLLKHTNSTIKFNEMTKDIDIWIKGELIKSEVIESMFISLCNEYDYPPTHFDLMLIDIAHKNSYHPVRDWIESEKWDGISRLEEMYSSVISNHPMKETLLKKWMISCVAAVYEKVFSSEGSLIFIGEQGLGKTTWLWSLTPQELKFMKTGSSIDPNNKDSLLKSLSHWIVELGEITQTMNKNDINELKAFLSDNTDIIRAPYARRASVHPRRTIFCGSTNEDVFLADNENRRFWTIPVSKLTQLYDVNVQQLWAEVYELYLKSDKNVGKQEWFLTKEEKIALYVTQEEHSFVNPIHELLESRLKPVKGMDYEKLNATAILIRCGINAPNRHQTNQATTWLKKNNYTKHALKTYWVNISY